MALADIVMKALAPALSERYARASDVLHDVLAAREAAPRRVSGRTGGKASAGEETVGDIQARLRARDDAPPPRFCWHCSKPLHARADKCPFCGEAQ